MDHLVSQSNCNLSVLPLICGLPDDIVLDCLARVPRKYHGVLKCVSRRWRDLLHSEEWFVHRRKHKLDETWLYALCRDEKLEHVVLYVLDPNSSRRSWKMIHELPTCTWRRTGMGFQVLGKNAYLLGGYGMNQDATREVYCYDASMNTWTEAAPMSKARCFFTSGVLNRKIYCIGGLSDPHSWDVYDPYTNIWKLCLERNVLTDVCDSFVMDGKIYARPSTFALNSPIRALVYDPSAGYWQHADADMASGWSGPAAVIDDTLYVLDHISRLRMWQKESREWVPAGRLPVSPILLPSHRRRPCQLVAIGKTIFIIREGYSGIAIDVENIGNVEEFLLTSSIPKLNDTVDIISCKGLAI